jgi:Nucleotide-diphospho-sugar transferase
MIEVVDTTVPVMAIHKSMHQLSEATIDTPVGGMNGRSARALLKKQRTTCKSFLLRSMITILFCICAATLHVFSLQYSRDLYSMSAVEPDDRAVVVQSPTQEKSVSWPPRGMIEAVIRSSHDYKATRQKRVVLAASNAEYVDFADNFANSLLLLNVTNFILIPLDAKAYRILRLAYPRHTVPTYPFSGVASNPTQDIQFGSSEFQQLTASRPNFLRRVLELNYTILYNDIDMVWKQNAWDILDERIAQDYRHLERYPKLQAASRRQHARRVDSKSSNASRSSKSTTTMLWHDGPNQVCTCMMYMLPTRENSDLLMGWENEIRQGDYVSDQAAFVSYLEENAVVNISASASTARGHTVLFINDEQFPHGRKYVWAPQEATAALTAVVASKRKDDDWSTSQNYSLNLINTERTIIVHNNWIKGKQSKKERFVNVGLWNPSGLLPT